MDIGLIASAALMGLAGTPHCAAMCGAPCTALVRRCGGVASARPGMAGLLAGRLAGYMAAGAAVAGSVAALSALAALAPALRPLWLAVHVTALGLGIWMLIGGRMPAWLASLGRSRGVVAPAAGAGGWQRGAGPLRAGAAGTLWVALPCGLLQSALLVAALASTPWQGAVAMAAFAAASSPALVVPTALWSRRLSRLKDGAWLVRASGAALAAASAWVLGHGLWQQVAAFCAAG